MAVLGDHAEARDERSLQSWHQRNSHDLFMTLRMERRAPIHTAAAGVAHLKAHERRIDAFAEGQDDRARRPLERPAVPRVGVEELRVTERRGGERQPGKEGGRAGPPAEPAP
jgi:DNA-binding IclR family transcriptional regulator